MWMNWKWRTMCILHQQKQEKAPPAMLKVEKGRDLLQKWPSLTESNKNKSFLQHQTWGSEDSGKITEAICFKNFKDGERKTIYTHSTCQNHGVCHSRVHIDIQSIRWESWYICIWCSGILQAHHRMVPFFWMEQKSSSHWIQQCCQEEFQQQI